jgi:hypothetical protein
MRQIQAIHNESDTSWELEDMDEAEVAYQLLEYIKDYQFSGLRTVEIEQMVFTVSIEDYLNKTLDLSYYLLDRNEYLKLIKEYKKHLEGL